MRRPRGVWLLLLALLAGAEANAARTGRTRAPGARSVRPASAAGKRTATGTAARRRASVFRSLETDRLGLLVSIARSDPFLRAAMDAVLADGAKLINNTGKAGADRARRAWVPLVSNRPLRRAVVRTILRDINGRSEKVKDLIRSDPAPVWDTVFIGAGVHTAAAAAALGESDPAHRSLVIEAGELVSANFASLGETIAINSSNRQETGEGVQPFGRGNNNPNEGPIGVPDLSGDKWPAADTLSDVATVSLHTSGADVVTRSAVSRVSERGAGDAWPARYKIETADGLTVYAASVVVGTGLGKPTIKVRRGARLIESETAKVDLRRPDDVPGIMYYSQAMALANQSAVPRDPYRAQPGGRTPRIAVIGGGDSGRTFLELMYGLAPSNAYDGPGKRDRAQRGEVGALDWVVGPDGPTDCKSFLDRVRARYARISPSIKSGRAQLVNRTFVGVEKRGDRFRVLYSDGSSRTYDKVIIATGFESQAPAVLAPVLPAGYDQTVPFVKSNAVEKVSSKVGGGLRKPRSVAKRVVGQDVFLIGPAAGDDLVDRNEILVKRDRSRKPNGATEPQIAISENLASIKFLVPFSAALARNVLPERKASGPRLDTTPADERLRTALVTARGKRSQGRRIRRAKVAEPDDPASDPARTGIEPIVLKHEMATVLDDFTYGRLRTFELRVEPEPGGLLLLAPQLGEASIASVRDEVERNYALVQMLSKFARVGKSVTFRVAIARDGTIDVDSLTMAY
ncbi:MAG TPA: hypothetical protein VFU21_04880 [Kofleriaceae bacterium]|nr:hypothetical protein [Kofleriaceae bacterium]